jgi:hypothetical protein
MFRQRSTRHNVVELLEKNFLPGSGKFAFGVGKISRNGAQRRKFLSSPEENLGSPVIFLISQFAV